MIMQNNDEQKQTVMKTGCGKNCTLCESTRNKKIKLFGCRRGDPYMTANRNFLRFAHS